ncbi:TRAP transporter large permease [Propionivibrio dicarboxylicus]|uniref:C4-dicarboxylate transporter, DctM subunit n=1 Tax=Propionivibrio dicarboxylicus TaxID=83767 RepID=A0A1G7ZCR5_9RHOO|nr:TRAP transporter large permease subunit [Propionivibrio dicarboxylicus]SDH06439.1 C4-dicarboxylate transporter, DctM subunit [Propionivibrio dicarboxylicus]
MNATIIFLLLLGLMLTGMPISISLGLTVLSFLFLFTQVPLESVALKLFTGIEKFEIMAIPFFILAGNFLTHGGVARRMIRFATALVGHWPGGLGLAGVLACALFAAISGSSPATVVAIGSILLPAMVKAGFPNKFGAGVITTSGALGILIPPSIVMVMYSVATNTSVGALFMAGVLPGLLLALVLGLVTWYRAWKFGYPRAKLFAERSNSQASIGALFGAYFALIFTAVPPLIVGSLLAEVLPSSGLSYLIAGFGWLLAAPWTTRNKWVIRFVYVVLNVIGVPMALSLGILHLLDGVPPTIAMVVPTAVTVGWLLLIQACGAHSKIAPTFRFELMWESLEVWRVYWESIWGLLLILVVMGGIYAGLFTPTEAAAMSAVYAFVVAVFVYKDLKLADVPRVLLSSANMSAMLLYIITNAVLFSFIMTNENIPQALADWMLGNGLGHIAFLLAVNVVLLVAGNFMEPSSIVLIFAPILFPVATKLGIDPVHFGIIMVVNMEVGMCHPPVGLNLYVASGITRMGITELTVAVWPWLLSMLGFLVLVTYWPGLSIWLPKVLGMM